MVRILFFLLFFGLSPCVFGEEIIDKSVIQDVSIQTPAVENAKKEDFYPNKTTKIRKHSDISPIKEHIKTKNREQKALEKNKIRFKKRVNNELFLLQIY